MHTWMQTKWHQLKHNEHFWPELLWKSTDSSHTTHKGMTSSSLARRVFTRSFACFSGVVSPFLFFCFLSKARILGMLVFCGDSLRFLHGVPTGMANLRRKLVIAETRVCSTSSVTKFTFCTSSKEVLAWTSNTNVWNSASKHCGIHKLVVQQNM